MKRALKTLWGTNRVETKAYANGSSFASCCGSRYYTKCNDDAPHTSQGISLYNGKFGEERTTDVDMVKHIETKNGVLTVAIRSKW